jgi:hypothetical protein
MMPTVENNLFVARQDVGYTKGAPDPMVLAAQKGAKDSKEFMLWSAEQTEVLSRLKVFRTMAKSINDQQ